MNKNRLDSLIKLTQECLSRYWQHDYEFVLGYCSPNVTWIGANQEQFMQGIEEVRADFEKTDKEIVSCFLSHQEYHVAHNCGSSASIAGRYLVTTEPGTGELLQVQQRALFIWESIEEEVCIRCICVSNPLGELALVDGELFPNYLGKMSAQYLEKSIRMAQEGKTHVLQDRKGISYFLTEYEIVYVEAEQHSVHVNTLDTVIHIKMQMSQFLEKEGDFLVAVHRSYAVNPMHISHIMTGKIIMDNGMRIPVPVRKMADVKKMLKDAIRK